MKRLLIIPMIFLILLSFQSSNTNLSQCIYLEDGSMTCNTTYFN